MNRSSLKLRWPGLSGVLPGSRKKFVFTFSISAIFAARGHRLRSRPHLPSTTPACTVKLVLSRRSFRGRAGSLREGNFCFPLLLRGENDRGSEGKSWAKFCSPSLPVKACGGRSTRACGALAHDDSRRVVTQSVNRDSKAFGHMGARAFQIGLPVAQKEKRWSCGVYSRAPRRCASPSLLVRAVQRSPSAHPEIPASPLRR